MKNNDEQRYADYLAQQQDNQPEDNPLEEVRKIRAEQLAACDLKKHQEIAQMRKQLEDKKRKAVNHKRRSRF